MTRPPFVVVGESLVDIVLPASGEPTHAVGGSPMNIAVGLARLDVPTLLITEVGDDEHGRWVVEHVRSSGATLDPGSVRAGARTSTATARLDALNTARYEFDLSWELGPRDLPDDVLGLQVGSLAASLGPGRDAVLGLVDQARAGDAFVSYDPNIRPAFVTDPEQAWLDLASLAGRCRLVKLSDEDLQALRPEEPVDTLVAELLAGPDIELLVVTRGAAGASAYTEAFSVDVPAPAVDVVDTVGAGDSFMAAALAILVDWELTIAGPGALSALDEDRVRILLAGSMAAAATTCSRRGANPPTRRELPTTWPAS